MIGMPPGPLPSSSQNPSASPRTPRSVEALLRELPGLRRAPQTPGALETPRRWPTGLAALDRLLGGGLPGGGLSEIAGPTSSGRTSLALALLATTTRAGEAAALVDAADAFDPASAQAAGADLERTLWVRARDRREALRAAHLLARARGFALILLDLARSEAPGGPHAAEGPVLRLSRAAAGGRSALVLLGERRRAGSWAELALELRPLRPRFSGAPPLLESLGSEVEVVRRRGGPPGGAVRLRFRPPHLPSPPRGPLPPSPLP